MVEFEGLKEHSDEEASDDDKMMMYCEMDMRVDFASEAGFAFIFDTSNGGRRVRF